MKWNQLIKVLVAIPLIFIFVYAMKDVQTNHQRLEIKKIQFKTTELQLNVIKQQLENEQKNLNEHEQTQKSLEDANRRIQELQDQIQQKDKQLQAKASKSTVYAESLDTYKQFIYNKESGNCPTKWEGQPGACPAYHGVPTDGRGYGLCQATPGNKMASAGADWATSYETQDRWCTQYAQKYGGWYGSYVFWQNNHWW